ncbi:MAG TPA: hypothetical protein ENI73_04390 [Spirochaetes bacterium]|nr:hypothetical protein [Spirochaetota bacterium]
MSSSSKEDKSGLSNNLNILSLLDDIRQEMVFNNENGAKLIEQNTEMIGVSSKLLKNSKEIADYQSLIDDIRQEMVDTKEQSAKIVAQNDQIIGVHKEMLKVLKNMSQKN